MVRSLNRFVLACRPSVPLGTDYEGQNCGLARALELVGERWTPADRCATCCSASAASATCRRGSTSRAPSSPTRLNELVEHGLVERRPYRQRPRRAAPDRRRRGAVAGAVRADCAGATTRRRPRAATAGSFTHAECGTDLPPTGRCPACEREPGPTEIVTRSGPGRRRTRAGPDQPRAARAAPAADARARCVDFADGADRPTHRRQRMPTLLHLLRPRDRAGHLRRRRLPEPLHLRRPADGPPLHGLPAEGLRDRDRRRDVPRGRAHPGRASAPCGSPGAPLRRCRFTSSRPSAPTGCESHRCVNRGFFDWPDSAPDAIRAFDLRDRCEP